MKTTRKEILRLRRGRAGVRTNTSHLTTRCSCPARLQAIVETLLPIHSRTRSLHAPRTFPTRCAICVVEACVQVNEDFSVCVNFLQYSLLRASLRVETPPIIGLKIRQSSENPNKRIVLNIRCMSTLIRFCIGNAASTLSARACSSTTLPVLIPFLPFNGFFL